MKNFLLILALLGLAAYFFKNRSGGGKVDFPMTAMSATTQVKAVEESKKVRVLLFTGTEWCPACKTLESQVIATPAWKEFASREIQFRVFNFPADRSKVSAAMQRMAQQYGVRAFPTMLVIGPDHQEISRQVGSGPPVENYKAWIRSHERFFQGEHLAAAPEKPE
jgi:thiol:disulfide interchange protein